MEHTLRSFYQWCKWNLPELFFSKSTRVGMHYDKHTIKFAKSVLEWDDVVVDIGANNGSLLRRFVKIAPLGSHIAFEPLPYFSKYLRAKFPTVDVREIALSNSTGKIEFFNFFSSPALSTLQKDRVDLFEIPFRVIKVDTDTLDNQLMGFSKIDFIKIDVEGHELEVLKGAEGVIGKFSPHLVIEVDSNSIEKIKNLLTDLNYEVSYLLSPSLILKLNPNPTKHKELRGYGYLKAIPKIKH